MKSINKCQRYDNFIACGSGFKNDTYTYWLDLNPQQQSILAVGFLWLPNSINSLIMWLVSNYRDILKGIKQRFRETAVTWPSCRFEIGGYNDTRSIGCCHGCKIQSTGLGVIFEILSTSNEMTISPPFVIRFQRIRCQNVKN